MSPCSTLAPSTQHRAWPSVNEDPQQAGGPLGSPGEPSSWALCAPYRASQKQTKDFQTKEQLVKDPGTSRDIACPQLVRVASHRVWDMKTGWGDRAEPFGTAKGGREDLTGSCTIGEPGTQLSVYTRMKEFLLSKDSSLVEKEAMDNSTEHVSLPLRYA